MEVVECHCFSTNTQSLIDQLIESYWSPSRKPCELPRRRHRRQRPSQRGLNPSLDPYQSTTPTHAGAPHRHMVTMTTLPECTMIPLFPSPLMSCSRTVPTYQRALCTLRSISFLLIRVLFTLLLVGLGTFPVITPVPDPPGVAQWSRRSIVVDVMRTLSDGEAIALCSCCIVHSVGSPFLFRLVLRDGLVIQWWSLRCLTAPLSEIE